MGLINYFEPLTSSSDNKSQQQRVFRHRRESNLGQEARTLPLCYAVPRDWTPNLLLVEKFLNTLKDFFDNTHQYFRAPKAWDRAEKMKTAKIKVFPAIFLSFSSFFSFPRRPLCWIVLKQLPITFLRGSCFILETEQAPSLIHI